MANSRDVDTGSVPAPGDRVASARGDVGGAAAGKDSGHDTRGDLLACVDAFRSLSPADRGLIEKRLSLEQIGRGGVLMRQGEPAAALFIVVSGRFHVFRDGQAEAMAEIGPGSPIGEIGFFAGGARTATVRAERDSVVLRLDRADFDALARQIPDLWGSIVTTLATRLARTTAGERAPRRARPRTVCLLRAGEGPVAIEFVHGLLAELGRDRRVLLLDAAAARDAVAGSGALAATATDGARHVGPDAAVAETVWFNDVEQRYDLVLYLADAEATDWSRRAIRQADLVVCIAAPIGAGGGSNPNPLERLAAELHRPESIWLVLVRGSAGASGGGAISGTAAWLAARPWVGLHHHVAAGTAADTARLARFVTGRALGLVACGGGAFSPSHVGLYEALGEAGLVFDAFGGTSGGAAMAAAFVQGRAAADIARVTDDMFVRRRAMRRWTLPRYSLLDHSVLEQALEEHFGDIDIADLPLPFFAVSTNLSRHEPYVHRTGSLWRAIRASSAIPALLPPVFSPAGDMLVDGCLVDNVPVRQMRDLKLGPNIVVDFLVPQLDRIEHPPAGFPSRRELARLALTRAGRASLPEGPSPQAVLLRGLMMNASNVAERMGPEDVLIELPMPEGASHLDWHRHGELRDNARAFGRRWVAERRAEGHALLP